MRLRALAGLYACGVVLAAPVTLHAEDVPPEPAAAPAPPAEAAPEAPSPAVPPASAPSPAPAPQAAPAAPAPPAPPPPPPEPPAKPVAAAAAAGSVRMLDFRFSPAAVTVTAGDSVTWVNQGEEPHNAVGDGVSTALLDPGESASKTFASAGTFAYLCTVHPQMKGTVKVVAAAQTGGGSEDSGRSAAAPTPRPTARERSPELANTGLDAWLLGLAGVALLAAGLAIRERSTA